MSVENAGRFEWERVFRRCRLPSTTKAVGFAMATYADGDGSRIYPGAARLAAVTGLSERSVRGALTNLRDLGLVHRTVKGGMRGTHAFADVYQLQIPADLLERFDLLTTDEEVVPNRQQLPPGPRSQPAAAAGTSSPNRQLSAPQPAAPSSQPAAHAPQPAAAAAHHLRDQPPTSTTTRTTVVQIPTHPQTARANPRCNKHGHEFSGWPCTACASETKGARRHAS
ncbi:helix-turn-helix domain-containing protein [Modestobacter sp. Leaf380]|uniref:helix-turn-helix domain-containing protein n=1 Tax=Modestobacter sp. Leaf380 TaxID=1736356 RepID=UPI0012FA01C1